MRLTELLRTVGAGALDLVFAPVCVACKRPITAADPERLICRVCWSRARSIPAPRCSRCWSPVKLSSGADSAPCALCATLPPRLRVARSAVVMEDRVREMVHGLKYGGWSALARKLAARMATLPLPEDVDEEARLVVPVPTSPRSPARAGV